MQVDIKHRSHCTCGEQMISFGIFNRSVYEDGHVFLMRKREDGSIEIHDSEVLSGAKEGFITVFETMNWMGNMDQIIYRLLILL